MNPVMCYALLPSFGVAILVLILVAIHYASGGKFEHGKLVTTLLCGWGIYFLFLLFWFFSTLPNIIPFALGTFVPFLIIGSRGGEMIGREWYSVFSKNKTS